MLMFSGAVCGPLPLNRLFDASFDAELSGMRGPRGFDALATLSDLT